jgi:cob(I)alamin adenosyltransferase
MKTYELKNTIKVDDWSCTKEGIQIAYTIDGKDDAITVGPLKSAELLEAIGAIEDHSGTDERLEVMVEYENQNNYLPAYAWISWELFISGFDLSQKDAIRIVEQYEENKHMDKWAKEMKSIPKLIAAM